MFTLEIRPVEVTHPDASGLINELSADLAMKTGRDGRASFAPEDVTVPRSSFLVAYLENEPIGCGALRPLDADTCELKRMFAKTRGQGVGAEILKALEKIAVQFRYRRIRLETGSQNLGAIKFYLKHGYKIGENFGKYVGRLECICFEKIIAERS